MRRLMRAGALGTAVMMLLATPGTALAQETDEARPTDSVVDDARPTDSQDASDRHPNPCRALNERAQQAIEIRLAAIDRMQEAIRSNDKLTPAHAEELQAQLAHAERGLKGLAEEIHRAPCDELPRLVQKIVDDFRVFVLLVPKVHLVIAADSIAHVVHRLGEAAGWLQEMIERFEEAGYDVSAAQAELGEMKTQLESAAHLAGPIPGKVLPLTPEDWPQAQSVIQEAARMVRNAGGEVRAAWMSAHQVIRALRELRDG